MSVEETGETRVRTDCLNFDVSNAYKIKKLLEALRLYFLWDFKSHCSSRCTKFNRLMTNALLQLLY